MQKDGKRHEPEAPGVFRLPVAPPSGTFRSALDAVSRTSPAPAEECDVEVLASRDRQRDALDAVRVELAEEARGYARRLRLLVRLARETEGVRFTELEMAGSWHVSQLTAAAWTADAERFETCLPQTLAMLDEGTLAVQHAKVLLTRTRHCREDVARAVEAELLPAGATLCPSDLRKRVDRVVLRVESEQADPAAAEQRHAEAVAARRTFAKPELDGMGLAGALLTAEQLVCWQHGMDLLERRERVADREAGVERSADQRRADLFAALPALVLAGTAQDRGAAATACPCGRTAADGCCLAAVLGPAAAQDDAAAVTGVHASPDGPTAAPAAAALAAAAAGRPVTAPAVPLPPPPALPLQPGPLVPWTLDHAQVAATITVNVHVPMATVLDLARAPGALDRYGPVSAEHVRLLRPRQYRRVLVDGETGVPLAVDDRPVPAAADVAAQREQLLAMSRVDVVTDRDEPQHDPSARLARLVDVRDVHCCGPGCSSSRTDRDHLEPHPAGPTSATNLSRVSTRCHQAKHDGWVLVRHPDGSTSWTGPLGRRYDRPGPHTPPPRVTVADPPLVRPEPVVPVDQQDRPWVVPSETAAAEPARPTTPPRDPQDDEPPF